MGTSDGSIEVTGIMDDLTVLHFFLKAFQKNSLSALQSAGMEVLFKDDGVHVTLHLKKEAERLLQFTKSNATTWICGQEFKAAKLLS